MPLKPTPSLNPPRESGPPWPEPSTCHPACVACRPRSEGGLGLRFEMQPDGSLLASFECHFDYRSYPDRVHGGVVALLLDAAMSHCLFGRGIAGITGRLNIGFRAPLRIGGRAEIRTFVADQTENLYRVRAEITQDGELKAQADGKFLPRDEGG